MKKKIALILAVFILLFSVGVVYLNNVLLPKRIKSLLVSGLHQATQKDVSLESLQFSVFKGLVLKNLSVDEGQKNIFHVKEASCSILIFPLFKKIVIIPSIKIRSPEILFERRKDNTLNLQDLFVTNGEIPGQEFKFLVHKLTIIGGSVHFVDETLPAPFFKDLKNVDFTIFLSFPLRIKFIGKADVASTPLIKISTSGEYNVKEKQLSAKVSLQDFSPQEFLPYYQNLGFSISQGQIDTTAEVKLRDGIIESSIDLQDKGLTVTKDKISVKLNAKAKADVRYNFKDQKLTYKGNALVRDSGATGIEFVDTINSVNGEIRFSDSGISSQKLRAVVLGQPLETSFSVSGIGNPQFELELGSKAKLDFLQSVLKDKFNLALPGSISGDAQFYAKLQGNLPLKGVPEVNGYIKIPQATLKLEAVNLPFENIKGTIEFNQNQMKWPELNFTFQGAAYRTEGVLTNFQAPGVQLALSSEDISLNSNFAVNNKIINFSKLSGKYFNSEFNLSGEVDTAKLPGLFGDLSGDINIDLQDLSKPFKKFQEQLAQIKPQGQVAARLKVEGNLKDIKNLRILAKVQSESISLYGFKGEGISLTVDQTDGIANIPDAHFSFYEGAVDTAGELNLAARNPSFLLNAVMQGVNLEKLKMDTAAKKEDVSGTISGQASISGALNDTASIKGDGKIDITEGKLWQLNLFKGLGSLLFTKDFSNIVFNEGHCEFIVKDKLFTTDNLNLKSNISDLNGSVRLGFDNSIDATLNVKVLDEGTPLNGTLKDITTAIIGQAGRFGVIKISGTLKEPKYKFSPAVVDILKGLKNAIFGK